MSAGAIRAGAAYIELTLRDRVSRPLHAASIALKDFGNAVAWQGAKIAAMGAAITAPLAAMAHSFAQAALEGGQLVNRRDAANVMNYVGALMRLQAAFGELRNAIGSAVLPLMTKWPATLARIVSQAAAWVRENRGLVQSIAKFASILAAAGAGLVVVGRALSALGSVAGAMASIVSGAATAVSVLGGILASILTPIGLVIAGAVALGAYILTSTEIGQQALDMLGGAFGQLHDDALQAWQGIADALATGDIALAGKILWDALKLEWIRGVDFINQIWISAKEFFVGLWTDATFAVAMLLTDPWYVMETAYNETIGFMQQGWLSFTGFLSKNLNWAVGEMEKLWARFRKWLGADIDVNAQINRIDQTTAGANDILGNQTSQAKADAQRRRDQRRQEIENNRTPAGRMLGGDWQRKQEENSAAFEQQRQESRDAVTAARREFTDSTKKAKEQREKMEQAAPDPVELPVMLGEEKTKLEGRGTFSAMAARGLGANSLADRTAKATEASAGFLKNINEQVKKAGMVFA